MEQSQEEHSIEILQYNDRVTQRHLSEIYKEIEYLKEPYKRYQEEMDRHNKKQ